MKTTEVKLVQKEIVAPRVEYILELGQIQIKATNSDKRVFKAEGTKQLGQFLISEIGNYAQEVLQALYLNTQNEVIYKQNLYVGTVDKAVVSPFQVIQNAVLVNATRVVIAHNHPSKHAEYPSDNDVEFAQKLNICLGMMGAVLLDSFVVSTDGYFSLAESGLLSEK